MVNSLKRRVLGLSKEEALFSRRGFPGGCSESTEHLETVLGCFIDGYNMALDSAGSEALVAQLDSSFSPAFVGFAYEGAGLWFALTDLLLPSAESRLRKFLRSSAARHDFIASVGAGFAIARAPLGVMRMKSYRHKLDPMSAWCMADGYGFHQGFFHWKRFIERRQPAPRSFGLQDRALFDAGVGRSMWWVFGAEPAPIAAAISGCDSERRPEMWAGIGTALAYAGGVSEASVAQFLNLSGSYRADLLSGIPFAAHMRHKGGNKAEWTDKACIQCLGMSVAEASAMIVAELQSFLDSWTGTEEHKWDSCYLVLRSRVRRRLESYRPEFAGVFTAGSAGEKTNVQ